MTPKNTIPDSLLVKLFDETGDLQGSNKGYMLFSINSEGEPTCISNFANKTVNIALAASAKNFLENVDQGEPENSDQ